MNNRMKASLDNYITGGRYYTEEVDCVCKECGYKFQWILCHEYGSAWYLSVMQNGMKKIFRIAKRRNKMKCLRKIIDRIQEITYKEYFTLKLEPEEQAELEKLKLERDSIKDKVVA